MQTALLSYMRKARACCFGGRSEETEADKNASREAV